MSQVNSSMNGPHTKDPLSGGLRVLVAAYACDPYLGSEAGVGWAALKSISRKHEVFLITGDRNRPGLKRASEEGIMPGNVRIKYISEPHRFHENRMIARLQNWLRYREFIRQVFPIALEWHHSESFDLCHQVTIATWRIPSPLWKMPIPCVWGPVGGAGTIPSVFRPILSPPARFFERIRDIRSMQATHSSGFRQCMENTAVVLAANQETVEHLLPHRGTRPLMKVPIVSLSPGTISLFARTTLPSTSGPLRCFAGGNMIGSKGLAFALKALKISSTRGVNFHYTIAGFGPEVPAMKILAAQLGISDKVLFHDGYSGQDYIDALRRSDVYLLPSFREGTPVSMLEACLAGCYPVVADVSAPGEIVHLCGGRAAPIDSMDGLIEGLADAIAWCSNHRDALPRLATSIAAKVADHFSSERYETTLEEAYRIALGGRK
jgi:glycosyltransferase involved in cell wall biosynthesis